MCKCEKCNTTYSNHLGSTYRGYKVDTNGRTAKTINLCDDCNDSLKWADNDDTFQYETTVNGYMITMEY